MVSIQKIISDYTADQKNFKNNCNSRIRKDLLLIISKIKNVSPDLLRLFPENFSLNDKEMKKFGDYMQRYEKNEPVSKIINCKSFWLHDFVVNENVLDPRPETELIIETALKILHRTDKIKILDIGTGSGCILLSLLEEFPNSVGVGIDISEKAIEVAEINKKNIGIERAKFLAESCRQYFSDHHEKFDLIVSNPPYIKTADIEILDDNVKNFDPHEALDGGADGLHYYREFAPLAKKMLHKNGFFLSEIGYNQHYDVIKILEENNFFVENLLRDFAGILRVVVAKNTGTGQ